MLKVTFRWVRKGDGPTAEDMALSRDFGWKNPRWKWYSRALRGRELQGQTLETLKVFVGTMRGGGIEMMRIDIEQVLGHPVELLINGREPLAHAVWQDGQIRERDKKIQKLEETLRLVGRE